MNFGLYFLVNSALMGVGLAMDAFSVSIANGLNEPDMNAGKVSKIAGTFAFFQFLMPILGWVCVHTIVKYFTYFEELIPWIALILLLYIGIKMLVEGIRGSEDDEAKSLGKRMLLMQGIATSIDALSVGFAIAGYSAMSAVWACIIIAVATFVLCVIGLKIGKKAGEGLASKATIVGGIILIGIGLEIFIRAKFF